MLGKWTFKSASPQAISDEIIKVIVHGRAFDVTEFLDEHPGGSKIILKYAGKDATEAYEPIHPPDTLDKYLPKDKHLGEVDMGTVYEASRIKSYFSHWRVWCYRVTAKVLYPSSGKALWSSVAFWKGQVHAHEEKHFEICLENNTQW